MSFQSDFYAWLSAQSGVTAIVSTRIYPLRLPQEATYPAVRFERDAEYQPPDFDGQTSGITRSDLQVDALATTHAAAIALAEAISTALIDYQGAMGSTTVNRTTLDATFDSWEESLEVYRVSQAWTLWHY